jgi:hypothetical protein
VKNLPRRLPSTSTDVDLNGVRRSVAFEATLALSAQAKFNYGGADTAIIECHRCGSGGRIHLRFHHAGQAVELLLDAVRAQRGQNDADRENRLLHVFTTPFACSGATRSAATRRAAPGSL